MKRLAVGLIATLAFLAVGLSAQKDQTFTGEIMDSQCGFLGGHTAMLQKSESAKDCTLRCVKLGGKFVLFDVATKMSYQLDAQKKAEPFAGDRVKVTGTYDASTKTIHVTDIKAGS